MPFKETQLVKVKELPSRGYKKYIDERIEMVLTGQSAYHIFNQSILQFDKLCQFETTDLDLKDIVTRQALSGLVTSVEVYLSRIFISKILTNKVYLVNYIENHESFEDEIKKFSGPTAIDKKLIEEVKLELAELDCLNLYKLASIFESVFEKSFPEFSTLMDIILLTHRLIHGNGLEKNGEKILIEGELYFTARECVSVFVLQLTILLMDNIRAEGLLNFGLAKRQWWAAAGSIE